MALGCLRRNFGLALWICRSAVYWRHATLAEVLACCRYLRVVVENRSQVGPGMAVLEALGRQYGSGTAVSRALGRHVGHGMAVSGALGRQVGPGTVVSGALGRLERPQGRPGVQKRTPNSTRIDAAGTKIDAKWALEAKKTNFVTQLPQVSVLGCFLSIFGVFAKSAKPLKYRACQQKQGLGPLRCGSRWNLKKH